jgi:transposase
MDKFEKELKFREIIKLYKQKKSLRKISLEKDIPLTTVARTVTKFKEFGSCSRIKGSGRRPILESEDKKIIKENLLSDNKISAKRVAEIILETTKKAVSQWTVSREMRKIGFNSRVPALKPLLTADHKRKRYEIVLKWSMWPKNKFHNVIFSDECRFEINGSDGNQKIRRLPGTRYDSNNIKVWRWWYNCMGLYIILRNRNIGCFRRDIG